jgi:hypothetical protein
LRYGNAASCSRVTGKPEVILEWCQQGFALIEGLSGWVVVALWFFEDKAGSGRSSFKRRLNSPGRSIEAKLTINPLPNPKCKSNAIGGTRPDRRAGQARS